MLVIALNDLIEQFAPSFRHPDHFFTTNRHKLAGAVAQKFGLMGSEISLVTKKVDAGWGFYRCQDIVCQGVHN